MSLDDRFQDVAAFHDRFGHPMADRPTLLPPERVKSRLGWMQEELDEFRDATTVVDQADAMIDLMYFALGTLVEMGVRPDPLFEIVQRANMGKLWEDGRPRYDATGKVIKPATWRDPGPQLEAEIERQGGSGSSR